MGRVAVLALAGALALAFASPRAGASTAETAAQCGTVTPTLVGTDGANVLIGTSGADVIAGMGGNDFVVGLGGNDILCGGSGNDSLWGRGGNDRMEGGDGTDGCLSGAGTDSAAGCEGSDIPTPINASAALLAGNNLIAEVQGAVSTPGNIYVDYRRQDGGDTFRTRAVASSGNAYLADVTRLRPETVYTYTAVGTNALGETSEGPTGSFTTGPLPPGLQGASFQVLQGSPTHDLTFMEFGDPDFGGIVAIDGEGYIVWYFDAQDHDAGPLAFAPNGDLLYIMEEHNGPTAGFGIREVTPLGQEVRRVDAPCGPHGPWHHELQMLSDRDALFLSRDIEDPFNDPGRLQEGDTINVWDQTAGSVTEVWNAFNFLDPAVDRTPDSDRSEGVSWGGCDGNVASQDWTHGNSVRRGDDGSFLYSGRHLDQVVSIAPDFRSLNWKLGGADGDFAFPDPTDRFYHQHAPTPLANGHVLLFDNGNTRPPAEGGEYSRVLELELDLDTMEAHKVWEYRPTPDLFAGCCSIAHRLANGNTLVVFGADFQSPPCCHTFTIVEVDAQGSEVWKVLETDPNKNVQYRIYPADSVMGEARLP